MTQTEILDAADFQREALNRKLWKVQKDICEGVYSHLSSAIKGCHASGKTYVVSGLVHYHLVRYSDGIVINIAPTLRQVKLMWNEIALACDRSKLRWPELSTTGLMLSKDNYAIGFSSSRGVNAQGFHGSNVLIIVDEAPGISADVWDAIEGIRAGGNVRLLKLGNPTVSSGPFFEDFGRGRASTHCITISAFDTPNLAGVTIEQLLEMDEEKLSIAPHPHLVTRRWVREKYERWGPNNPRYRSRVLGEFPTQSEHAVFSLEWIEKAKREPTETELQRVSSYGLTMQVGIDVAGPGDDETTGCVRIGGIILERKAWADKDPRGPVLAWLHKLKTHPQYRLGHIVVDVVGIGYNFALHIADNGFDVMGFNAGHKPMDTEMFLNAKAEAYFRLRGAYREGEVSHMPDALDEETEAQLSGINYKELPNGRIQIEPKEDARKRGVASPDRAEAEVMAFCRVVAREETVDFTDPVVISAI
jgi:hypothetical protein